MLSGKLGASMAAALGTVVALFSALMLHLSLSSGVLLDPVDPRASAAATGLGFCAVAGFLVLAVRRSAGRGEPLGGGQALNVAAGLFFFCFVVPGAALRDGVKLAAFAGLSAPAAPEFFTVAGTHISWWSKRSSYYVDLVPPSGGEAFALRASRGAYEAARPGARVTLPVQVGRRGVRRAIVPDPLTLSDLRRG